MPTTNVDGSAGGPEPKLPAESGPRDDGGKSATDGEHHRPAEAERHKSAEHEQHRPPEAERAHQPTAVDRYLVPILAVGSVLWLQIAFPELLGRTAPFALLAAAIAASAWWGRLTGGLLALALGTLATTHFFLPRYYGLTIFESSIEIRVLTLVAEAALFTWLLAWAEWSRERSEQSARRAHLLEIERAREHTRGKTARSAAEHAQETAESARRWLWSTLSSIGDAVIATEASGLVSFMNPVAAELTGWGAEEAVGKPLKEVFTLNDPRTKEPIASPIDRYLAKSKPAGFSDSTLLIARNGVARAIADRGAPISNERGETSGVLIVFRDVTKDRLEDERRRFLAEATATLTASPDYPATLRSLAQLTVPKLADWCTVELIDEDGSKSRQLAVAHADPAKAKLAHELAERYPTGPFAQAAVKEAMRTGKAEIYADIPKALLQETAIDDEHLRIMLDLGLESALVVPLIGGAGRALGAITLIYSDARRRYERSDLTFAEELARGAAIAIENARLFFSQRRAQDLADAARLRIAALEDVAGRLADALTAEEVAKIAVEEGAKAVGATSALLYVAEPDGSLLLRRQKGLFKEEEASLAAIPAGSDLIAAHALRQKEPLWIEDTEGDPRAFSELAARAKGASSPGALAALPLSGDRQVFAVLTFGFASSRELSKEDRTFIVTLSHHVEQALDRARLYAGSMPNEAAAQIERERIESLFMQAPIAIILVRGPEHTFELLNPLAQQMFGSGKELIGLPIAEAIPGIDRRTIEVLDEILATGIPYVGRGLSFSLDWNRDGSTSERFLDVNWQPIRGAGGAIEGVMILFADVTERVSASRAKDEFLAVVSHELRTPLTSIMGWTYLLRSARLSEAQRAKAIEAIDRNARAQTRLVEDLLDISRIISSKLLLEVRSVDLEKTIAGAIDAARPVADAKGVSLSSKIEPGLGGVMGDEERLEQVLWNVIDNAIKFTEKGGSVEVTLQGTESEAEIKVRDTGRGIEPDFMPFLFERFRQADSGTTREPGGLGLGLSITRHIVELHGGSIQASSAGKNMGSELIVKLPRAGLKETDAKPADGLRRTRERPSQPEAPADLDGLRLLIVDDDSDTRDLLIEVLGDCHALVVAASTTEEALLAFQTERPDLILSDVEMPGDNGYALIRAIRALATDQGGSTPAIALTAHARPIDRSRALQEGFTTHVTKPVDPVELIRMISDLARPEKR